MIEVKTKIEKIFKNGGNFEFRKFDYSSPEASKRVEILKMKQDEIIESSKVNLNELRKITFDI
jgi:hypothetical protein